VKIQAVITIVRDVGCLVIGLAGIAHQEITGRANAELLIVYMTLLGIPGALGLLQLSRGKATTTDTHAQSSLPPSSASSSDSR
jgi:hypothetical protein